MFNPNFAVKPYSYSHEFFLPDDERIELNLEENPINSPFEENPKTGFTGWEIKLIADKISDKLVKIVEQQLTESS